MLICFVVPAVRMNILWSPRLALRLYAIVITLAAVLGSVTAAWALWYVLYKRNKEGQV